MAQKVTGDLLDDKSTQKSVNEDNADAFDHSVTNKLFDLFSIDAKANSYT